MRTIPSKTGNGTLFFVEIKKKKCLPAGFMAPVVPNPPSPLRAERLERGMEPNFPAYLNN
jgi:hypothetical protein